MIGFDLLFELRYLICYFIVCRVVFVGLLMLVSLV